MKVYILTTGDYSAYTVAYAASSLEKAKEIMSLYPQNKYDDWNAPLEMELDALLPSKNGTEYEVIFTLDSLELHSIKKTENIGLPNPCEVYRQTYYPDYNSEYLSTYVVAIDKQSAIKIASERFREYKSRI